MDSTDNDPAANYRTVRRELEAYGGGLSGKTEIVALNKCDALSNQSIENAKRLLELETGKPILITSGVSGTGLTKALRLLVSKVVEHRPINKNFQ